MGEDQFAGVSDLVPDGAVPVSSIRICRFLTVDGDYDLHLKADGVENLATSIGVLELAKSLLIEKARESE
jgi:hypothetical protein